VREQGEGTEVRTEDAFKQRYVDLGLIEKIDGILVFFDVFAEWAKPGYSLALRLDPGNQAPKVGAVDVDGFTPLLIAGNISVIKILLEAGANVNIRHAKGMMKGCTPLMQAALDGDTETVKLLLQKGADVNAKDEYGMTALQAADENSEIIRLLKEAGAKE
jgi:ankyrin repeat protein